MKDAEQPLVQTTPKERFDHTAEKEKDWKDWPQEEKNKFAQLLADKLIFLFKKKFGNTEEAFDLKEWHREMIYITKLLYEHLEQGTFGPSELLNNLISPHLILDRKGGRVFKVIQSNKKEQAVEQLLSDFLSENPEPNAEYLTHFKAMKSEIQDTKFKVRLYECLNIMETDLKQFIEDEENLKKYTEHEFYQLIIPVLIQICKGLSILNKLDITHNDLAAKNILLSTSPDGTLKARITDFELATFKGERFLKNPLHTGDSDESCIIRLDFCSHKYDPTINHSFSDHQLRQASNLLSLGILFTQCVGFISDHFNSEKKIKTEMLSKLIKNINIFFPSLISIIHEDLLSQTKWNHLKTQVQDKTVDSAKIHEESELQKLIILQKDKIKSLYTDLQDAAVRIIESSPFLSSIGLDRLIERIFEPDIEKRITLEVIVESLENALVRLRSDIKPATQKIIPVNTTVNTVSALETTPATQKNLSQNEGYIERSMNSNPPFLPVILSDIPFQHWPRDQKRRYKLWVEMKILNLLPQEKPLIERLQITFLLADFIYENVKREILISNNFEFSSLSINCEAENTNYTFNIKDGSFKFQIIYTESHKGFLQRGTMQIEEENPAVISNDFYVDVLKSVGIDQDQVLKQILPAVFNNTFQITDVLQHASALAQPILKEIAKEINATTYPRWSFIIQEIYMYLTENGFVDPEKIPFPSCSNANECSDAARTLSKHLKGLSLEPSNPTNVQEQHGIQGSDKPDQETAKQILPEPTNASELDELIDALNAFSFKEKEVKPSLAIQPTSLSANLGHDSIARQLQEWKSSPYFHHNISTIAVRTSLLNIHQIGREQELMKQLDALLSTVQAKEETEESFLVTVTTRTLEQDRIKDKLFEALDLQKAVVEQAIMKVTETFLFDSQSDKTPILLHPLREDPHGLGTLDCDIQLSLVLPSFDSLQESIHSTTVLIPIPEIGGRFVPRIAHFRIEVDYDSSDMRGEKMILKIKDPYLQKMFSQKGLEFCYQSFNDFIDALNPHFEILKSGSPQAAPEQTALQKWDNGLWKKPDNVPEPASTVLPKGSDDEEPSAALMQIF